MRAASEIQHNGKALSDILQDHAAWLRGDPGGSRAVLRGPDLRGADLTDADLRGAVLTDAVLTDAVLRDANLTGAVLRGAVLISANLTGAVLRGAVLISADLTDAVLRGAVLISADLTDAVLRGAVLPHFEIAPEQGSFDAWKAAEGALVRLEVPPDARRTSSLVGRKCRAEFVRVVEVIGAEEAISKYDGRTVYRAGEIVRPDRYCDDIRVEGSHGIHFFMTRKEAEEWL